MSAPATRTSSTDPLPADEAAFVLALKRGDGAAFERLVRDSSGPMLAVTRRIMRNEEDAKDALQDAFVAVFRSIGSFAGDSRLSTWLHRIAVNASLMKLRTRRRHPEIAIDDLLPKYSEDGHDLTPVEAWQESAAELATQNEARAFVRKCVDELPENYRTVLVLRDLEGIPTEEVARLLDTTPNAIKIRAHRARQVLRTKLDRLWGGEPDAPATHRT